MEVPQAGGPYYSCCAARQEENCQRSLHKNILANPATERLTHSVQLTRNLRLSRQWEISVSLEKVIKWIVICHSPESVTIFFSDECIIDTCGAHGDCANTLGSFSCFCHRGFRVEIQWTLFWLEFKIKKWAVETCQRIKMESLCVFQAETQANIFSY